MSQTRIETLTSEQEALIPVYREKWRAIALSTESIDRQKASLAIKAAYHAIDKQEPKILFCDSPNAALNTVSLSQLRNQRALELGLYLRQQLGKQLDEQLSQKLHAQLVSQISSQLESQLGSQVSQLVSQLGNPHQRNCFQPELRAGYGSLLDFCFSVLKCVDARRKGEAFQLLVKSCGWIYPLENMCIVCDRPIKRSFDTEQRLHGIGEPAIQFVDGYSLYSYHGVTLPEKYGKWHPDKWQARWLLTETNAEIRRVLIQGIGYARICKKLQATELDY